MNAEQKLKGRVKRILVKAGFGQSKVDTASDEALELFHAYLTAPPKSKAEVYDRGESKIIDSLLGPRVDAARAEALKLRRPGKAKAAR